MYKISTINNTLFLQRKNSLKHITYSAVKIHRRLYFITLKVQKMLKEESQLDFVVILLLRF